MFLISLLFLGMSKLTSSGGNYKLSQAIGKQGVVYIRVPAKGQGAGRIQITLNNQMRELDAVTELDEEINTSAIVKITKIINAKLVVERV